MPAPVRNTCPNIDNVIKKIKSAEKDAINGRIASEDNSVEFELFQSIEDELYNLESDLESLRSANSSLRDWGLELEIKLEEAEGRAYYAEEELSKLNLEIQ